MTKIGERLSHYFADDLGEMLLERMWSDFRATRSAREMRLPAC
jgi:hypothetical protein